MLVTGLAVSLGVRAGGPGLGDVAWDGISLGQVGTTATSGSQGSPCPHWPCPALKLGELVVPLLRLRPLPQLPTLLSADPNMSFTCLSPLLFCPVVSVLLPLAAC